MILYYSAFLYAFAYAIAPMRLLGLCIDRLFYLWLDGVLYFSGVSSLSLHDFSKPFLNLNFLKMHWMKLADGSFAKCCLLKFFVTQL